MNTRRVCQWRASKSFSTTSSSSRVSCNDMASTSRTNRSVRLVPPELGDQPMWKGRTTTRDALHAAGFEIAIETNGSLPVLETIDWICVSPKADAPLVVTKGNELKVVIPQDNQRLADYAKLDFEYFLVQPMDGPSRDLNTKLAIDWCKRHPQWRLSMQTHKYLNIP